jgi:quercetin dioxygenase-like cupin family protein
VLSDAGVDGTTNGTTWRRRRLGDRLSVSIVEIRKGASRPPARRNRQTTIIVLRGAWHFYLLGREETVRDDEMFAIPAGAECSSEALEDTLAVEICGPGDADQPDDSQSEECLWAV